MFNFVYRSPSSTAEDAGHHYSNGNESPEYEEVRDLRGTTNEAKPLPPTPEQFSLKQCPAYVSTTEDIGFQNPAALYEVISPQ